MLVAVTLVTVLVSSVAALGIWFYAHEIDGAIANARTAARDFSRVAEQRHVPFRDAAIAFSRGLRHEGFHALAFPRRPPNMPPPGFGLPADPRTVVVYVDGVERRGFSQRDRLDGNAGVMIARLVGVRRVEPLPFVGGRITFVPDAALFVNISLMIAVGILLSALAAGLLAAAVGRYITSQAIRPLIDVTEALQRFAARDFRAQPILVDGRSDFDVLAQAYNAASREVAAAFAERDIAESQMRQFVADAGHELRTPLTIILGYIELLRRRITGEERTRFIFSSITSEGRRMRTLVDNLVLLAKLEGDDPRTPEPFDPGELVGEIVNVRRGLEPDVRFELDVRVAATVIGDRSELHEALANIVDNAIKYAPGSPIRVTVGAPSPGTVEIAVEDEGPGIPASDREVVFERFYRGPSRGEVEGSGLGLAIAKRAVERAGGTLRLDPTVARGTRFVIGLRADRLAYLGRTALTPP